MTSRSICHLRAIGHRTVFSMVLCFFVLGLLNAASRKGKRKPADERVRIVHADELMYGSKKKGGKYSKELKEEKK